MMFKQKTPSGTIIDTADADVESAKADSAKVALADGDAAAAAGTSAADAAGGDADAPPGADATPTGGLTAAPSGVVLESTDTPPAAAEKEFVGVKAKKVKSGITAEMLKELQEMEEQGEIEDDGEDLPAVERI